MKLAAPTALLFATLLHSALAVPTAEAAPNLLLEERSTKAGKGGKSGSGNNTSSAASDYKVPSRMLQGAVLGLGVEELVRLWG